MNHRDILLLIVIIALKLVSYTPFIGMSTEHTTPAQPAPSGLPHGTEPNGTEDDLSCVDAKLDDLRETRSWKQFVPVLPSFPEFKITEEQHRQWTAGTWFGPGEEMLQYMTSFPPDPESSILVAQYDCYDTKTEESKAQETVELEPVKPDPIATAPVKPRKKLTLAEYNARKAAKGAAGNNSDTTTPLGSVPMSASTSSQSNMSVVTTAKDVKDAVDTATKHDTAAGDRSNGLIEKV